MTTKLHYCEDCEIETNYYKDDYADIWYCEACLTSRAEHQYEKSCEDFHDGGSSSWKLYESYQKPGVKL